MISYMPLMRTLGERNLTVRELERMMGVSEGAVRKGLQKYLRTSTVVRIVEALDCSIDDVICWEEGDGVSGGSAYIAVDWEKVDLIKKEKGLTEAGISVAMGKKEFFIADASYKGYGLSPVDLEKLCNLLGVEKEDICR